MVKYNNIFKKIHICQQIYFFKYRKYFLKNIKYFKKMSKNVNKNIQKIF